MGTRTFAGEESIIKTNMELAKKRDFTVEDIKNLPEDVRAELIDGQIFYFAAPTLTHQRILGNLYMKIRTYIEGRDGLCEVFMAPVSVCLEDETKNYLEPDIIVVCGLDKLQEDGCHGSPDFIVEITSKSTRKRDYGIKMLKYRTAGVKEYWVVDPFKETIMVYWFEDETQNCLYGFQEEVKCRLFPGLSVQIGNSH